MRIKKRPRRTKYSSYDSYYSSSKKKRRIILCVILAIAIIIAIPIIRGIVKENQKITGLQWFFMQDQYIEDFETLADDTDTIVTLYITGSISEEDFQTHLQVLYDELTVMEASYEQDVEENPVKNGSHTYLSKKGCESVPACFEAFKNLYTDLAANSSDTDQLSYIYLAYHQEMVEALSDYSTVWAILYQGYLDDVNGTRGYAIEVETDDSSAEEETEEDTSEDTEDSDIITDTYDTSEESLSN